MADFSNEFTLREKKIAKTKLALANEFMHRMQTMKLSDISIKDVCRKVEVSEGTFYNYFPHKIDIACYFNKFTRLKLAWEIERDIRNLNCLQKIEYVFDVLADDIPSPFVFYEIIYLFIYFRKNPAG